MKILFIHKSYYPAHRDGGDTAVLYFFATELARLGHDITVYATNANGDSELSSDYMGLVNIKGVKVHFFPRSQFGLLRPRYHSPGLLKRLNETASEFDIVHIWHIFTLISFRAAIILRGKGVPYVVSPQANLSPVSLRKNFLLKRLFYYLFDKDTLICSNGIQINTEYELDWLEQLKIPRSCSMPVVAYSVPERAENIFLQQESKAPFFLFLGRIDRIKGLDFLLRAFDAVPSSLGLRLVLAGPSSPDYRREFLDQLRSARSRDRIEVLGLVDEHAKRRLLRSCCALVLPSYLESFGLVVVEAMRECTPMIISDQCNVRDHVRHGEAGYVLKHVEDDWARTLCEIAADKSLRSKLGANGRKYFEDNLNLSIQGQRLVDNYSAVLRRAETVVNADLSC